MLKKNEIVTITVTDISYDGNGIGKTEDGFVIFVPEMLIGETAEVKILKVLKNSAYAKVERLLTPSPSRQEAACTLAKKCGGCCFHHTSYENECHIKRQLVKNAFRSLGTVEVNPVIPSPKETCYRNKMLLPVGTASDGFPIAGFYRKRSHDIIPCNECFITDPEFFTIKNCILSHMKEKNIKPYCEESHSGIVRHIFVRRGEHSGEIMVGLVVNLKKNYDQHLATDELIPKLLSVNSKIVSIGINCNTKKTNVILGEETHTIYGKKYLWDTMNGIRFAVSLPSFYQINTLQAEKMYQTALELMGDDINTVFDLYCGIGTITLNLAKKAKKVYGIESCQPAVADAKLNQTENDIENVEFICGNAEIEAPKLVQQGIIPDAVMLDPPRSGCDKALINMLTQIKPQKIVYISCNPATQARDIKLLLESGYQLKIVQPFDLFPKTFHVENIVLLCREY